MAEDATAPGAGGAFSPGVPTRGLRVVMLATDERIDRRIIAEARTLLETGYDVYVLTAPIGGRGSFEHDAGVPVERVDVVRHAPSVESIGLRAQRKPRLQRAASAGLRAYRLARRLAGAMLEATHGLRVPSALNGWRLSGYEYAFFRRGLFYRPDVVHVHDLPLLKVGVLIREATGARVVYDMHEFYPEQVALTQRERRRLRRVERRYIHETDARFTVNQYLATVIAQAYEIEVDVVQNAIDVPPGLHERRHDRFRDELGIPRDQLILLYQGWLAPNRNLETMIEAMPLVGQKVVLVLMGYGEYRGTLEARARELDLGRRVFFVDAKSHEELLWYTASADVGLIPYPTAVDVNLTYVSPNKLYEFVVARLPMLANDLPFVRSVVEPNEFGVVAKMDTPRDAARAIQTFPYDQLSRFRDTLAARAEEWTWQHEQEKLLAIYDRLLTRGHPT